MDTKDTRIPGRLANVAAWGVGWAISAILVFLVGTTLDPRRPWIAFLAAIPIGAAMFGVPIYLLEPRRRSPHRMAEALVWVLALAGLAVIFAVVTGPDSTAVNAVTTADMHRRTEYYRTWHYPRELVWFLWCLIAYAVVAGTSSVLLLTTSRGHVRLTGSAAAFSACVAASLVSGALLFVLFGPFLWALVDVMPGPPALLDVLGVAGAAFLTGCVVGAGLIAARRRFVVS